MIAGRRDFRFREGWAAVVLLDGTQTICQGTMYAPGAPRNLISYRDLRCNGIHLNMATLQGKEVIELRPGDELLAIALKAVAEDLYGVKIRCIPR